MNEEDRPTTEGTRNSEDQPNVVRLPRDWLGPREELIPFGPRADEAEPPSDEAASPGLPTAADFWSGEAPVAVHEAVHPDDAPHRPARHSGRLSPLLSYAQGIRSRQSRRALWSRRRERAAGRSDTAPRSGALSMPHIGRRGLVGGTLAAAATLAVVLSLLGGGSPTRGTGLEAARSSGGRGTSASKGFMPGNLTGLGGRVSRAVKAQAAKRRAQEHRARASRRRARRARGAPHPAAVVTQPVTYHTPASNGAGGVSSTAGGASSGGSTSSSSSGTGSGSSSTTPTATTTGGHSSGSQPALGAGGSLGPGSSPDG